MTYLIESPHSEEECLQALDETLARGPRFLAQFDWGCMAGQHTGWATVEAGSESEARNMVPTVVRSKARIIPLNKFTPDQIKSFHKMHS
jgi:hypothetical protein